MAYDKVVDSAVLDAGLKQIADAIREKAGTTDALAFPQAMADAIAAIQGGGATIEPLTITENGTYTAPDGIDGYSPVTVEVKGSDEELVITDFSYFHYYSARLDLLGKFDTSNGTLFSSMFENCKSLTSVPEMNTSKSITFKKMFYDCGLLTSVSPMDVSNGTNFDYMFADCKSLTSVPELNMLNGVQCNYMFRGCISLKSVPKMDMSRVGSCDYTFHNCTALTDLYLYNIRRSIQIGSGTSWGHLLTVDSLVHTIKELCTVTSSKTLTIGSANLEKIAGLYCRITDDTHEKKTMELCESTDEGAMTLTEYATAKGWQIK